MSTLHNRLITDTDNGPRETEILLEVAFRLRNITNVFSIKPTDAKSLEHALLQIAISIGHELLSIRFKNADLASIWRTYSPDERIRAFKSWLEHKDNQPSVFIVDDLDGLGDESLIAAALPSQAQVILYSARDPTMMESLERHGNAHHVSNMDVNEMASLMNGVLRKSDSRTGGHVITEVKLEAIAEIVSGHALGACRAITYILNVLSQTSDMPSATFIQAFSGSNWRQRRQFLEYKPRFGLSIMETFTISLDRMRRHHKEAALKFLELIALLSNSSTSLHSRDFLSIARPWLKRKRSDLPDYELFAQSLENQNEYFLELERTSIGVRRVVPGPLQIHPLWIEAIQQRAEHGGRLRWLRQILILCHTSFSQDPRQYARGLGPFKQNAAVIAARFGILSKDLYGNEEMRKWFDSSLSAADEEYIDILTPSIRSDDAESSMLKSVSSDDDFKSSVVPSGPHEDKEYYINVTAHHPKVVEPSTQFATGSHNPDTTATQIWSLHKRCKALTTTLNSPNPEKMSEEAFAERVQLYLGLLKMSKTMVLNEELRAIVQGNRVSCLEIFDMLIQMAPAFGSRNPMLTDLLRKQKEDFIQLADHNTLNSSRI